MDSSRVARFSLQSSGSLHRQEPGKGGPSEAEGALPAAAVAEIVWLYGLRNWVEQSYKQTRGALGWSQYQVRSDLAIRRRWLVVCCAFSFCWLNAAATAATGAIAEAMRGLAASSWSAIQLTDPTRLATLERLMREWVETDEGAWITSDDA